LAGCVIVLWKGQRRPRVAEQRELVASLELDERGSVWANCEAQILAAPDELSHRLSGRTLAADPHGMCAERCLEQERECAHARLGRTLASCESNVGQGAGDRRDLGLGHDLGLVVFATARRHDRIASPELGPEQASGSQGRLTAVLKVDHPSAKFRLR
jgi:hypothetical protein